MSLDEGAIERVSSALLNFFSPSGPSKVSMASSEPEIFSLPVASQPKGSSFLAANGSSATSSAVLSEAASSLGPVLPSLSGVAEMDPTSTDAAFPTLCSLQYLFERLSQRDGEFAKLDDKYIQREEIVTSLEARLVYIEFLLATSRLDCNTLRAANVDMLKSRGPDREELSTQCARVLELEADFQAPRAPHFDVTDVARDRDLHKILPQSLAAQVQGLHASCADTVRRAQGSQTSLCCGLDLLLNDFEPLYSS